MPAILALRHSGSAGTIQPLRGVWGNIDDDKVRAAVPSDLQWECEGLRIYIAHIGNSREARADIVSYQPSLIICGHSHILKIAREPERNLILMNPGAAGHVGWHKERTIVRFAVSEAKTNDVEAINWVLVAGSSAN